MLKKNLVWGRGTVGRLLIGSRGPRPTELRVWLTVRRWESCRMSLSRDSSGNGKFSSSASDSRRRISFMLIICTNSVVVRMSSQ